MNPMSRFPLEALEPHRERLNSHPVYGALKTLDDLRVFMEHHVFSVWDFMSLIKFLQATLAPTRLPWAPVGDPMVRRFINELVLEEESDEAPPASGQAPTFTSHFELYTRAMEEVGASTAAIRQFVATASDNGLDAALDLGTAPPAAAGFTRTTFGFIDTGEPHIIAAALAFGREHIIPAMFRSFLRDMGIGESASPAFHYYLRRHINLDEDFHAPMSIRMVEHFIGEDSRKRSEAVEAAIAAIDARMGFWDGVLRELPSQESGDR